MATGDFDAYYPTEPWSSIDIKERDWYVPELLRAFRQTSNYSQMVPVKVDFSAMKTKKMIWTGLYGLEPNINAIATRSLWLPTMHPDGWQQEMELYTYGGKIALHKYDELVTFFTAGGGRNAQVLAPLCRQLMSDAIVDQLETQIRNAFLALPVRYIAGGGTGFGDIGTGDTFDPGIALDIQLEFMYNGVLDPNNPNGVNAVAYSSPGQIFAAMQNSTYVDYSKYGDAERRLFRYEMGEYRGVRYVQHPINTLWNCGTITAQATVSSAISAGDGAPDPSTTTVLDIYKVGQGSGPTRYIQLGTFYQGSISDFAVGDTVSIHVTRSAGTTQPYTVQNAPLPTDGYKVDRQIRSVDTVNNRLTFTKPIQMDYSTDLGSGVYAYVTKGLHVHMAVILAAPGAVVGGFAQPPQLMFPPAIDDREAMYRVSWDGVYNYGLFRPEFGAVVFSAGYTSKSGYKKLGN